MSTWGHIPTSELYDAAERCLRYRDWERAWVLLGLLAERNDLNQVVPSAHFFGVPEAISQQVQHEIDRVNVRVDLSFEEGDDSPGARIAREVQKESRRRLGQ